jgi:alkanesulfonate monooxygenase SsuD/methylene tetrahydromethanopterin reductase-like flavin-dependent oxidoreductase (luciferase family)
VKFGITLSNRGILLGLTTVRKLLALADAVEASALFDSIWAGDALFANPRLDAFTLLAALSGRTERVTLGTACMGSFALRDPRVFAAEWASLDVLSNGRTRLSVCAGGGADAWTRESETMGIPPDQRRKRMIENISVLRHLWSKDNEPFHGDYISFPGTVLAPKPLQDPCPIWLTTNAGRLGNGQPDAGGSACALKRAGRIADGWMTHSVSPEGFRRSLATVLQAGQDAGRDMADFENILCHHVNVNDDADAALADAKRYLDGYYNANYTPERLRAWGVYGPPKACIDNIRSFLGTGCRRITFRLATTGDALAQFQRLTREVLPFV